MTDEKNRLLSVLLTVLVVAGTLPAMAVGATAATGNTAGNATTFHVTQGTNCYEVQPLGNGSQSVEEFYDYRPSDGYSSHGTYHLQDNQESKLFVYNGTNGYSLVFLHDKYAENDSDAPYGSTITFNFSGMPTDGSWVVQDDSYENTDDQWDTTGSEQGVNWMWSDGRNDGGAFLGIEGEEITITPKFNERAKAWGEWPYSGDQANRTDAWKLIDSDQTERALSMSENVTVGTGACPDSGGEDTTDPSAALSASPNPAANNEKVTLDASASTDEGGSGIAKYLWDFDGDGKTDHESTDAKVTHTYTSTGSYNASVTVVDGNSNEDVANVTVEVEESVNGSITYINATAVRVDGTFEQVDVHVSFYGQTGIATSYTPRFNVSGSTLITVNESGVNGSMITLVEAHKDNSTSDPYLSKQHPKFDYHAEAIEPLPVTISVENVTQTGNGTYEVEFGYHNPNDEALTMRDSTLSGNVSGDAPRKVEPGEHTFTVTWTPDSDSERASWTLNRSNFDQSAVTASTKSAGELGGDGSDGDGSKSAPPKAAISVPDEVDESQTLFIDARGSTDDEGIVEYKYYVNGDLLWQENNMTTAHPWRDVEFPDGPGTYEISVRVKDADGQYDWASENVTITPDDTAPSADIAVSGTKKVGEKVTFEATNLGEKLDRHESICWEFDGEQPGCWVAKGKIHPDWKTWTTTFETPGKKTVTLLVKDHAGNTKTVEKTVYIEAKSSNGGDGGDGGDGNDEGGFTGGDDTDTRTGGIGTADPDQNDDGSQQSDDQSVSAPLTDADGQLGSVVVRANANSNANVVVSQTAPKGVEAPTVAANGFEALSYLNVSGAQQATVSISKAKLNATGATPEDVSLFRYENGSWTAVETTVLNATDDAYRFRANATDGVFAVGIERPATAVTDLTVSSQRVEPGESVTFTVSVENTGRANGTHEVRLTVGGDVVATENVSVAAGETVEVTFDRTFDSSGVYEVSVGDARAEVVVKGIETETATSTPDDSGSQESGDSDANDETTTNNESTGVPGFGVGVSVVALVAAALIALRRRP